MPAGEQITRPRVEADIATNLRGSAPRTTVCEVGEQLPGPVAGLAEAGLALALLRAEYARLVAAARASVTAARAGSAHPLVYVEAELARHGGLPPQDTTVPAVLADARTAMTLAGRAANYARR